MNVPASTERHILVLGGGFAGVYAARNLERRLARHQVRVSLVNRDNYFVFQPLLPELVSGNVDILDTVNPIRSLLKHTHVYVRDVEEIDLAARRVTLSPGFQPRPLVLQYDHLVLALGNVTDFRGMPGLHEHALPFKNVADALHLRNHVIRVLEEASVETDPQTRRQLLTFVVAGGGFSGVEVAAELNDFVRRAVRRIYPIDAGELRVVLVHSGARVLDRELGEKLSKYATRVLQRRGVELVLQRRLKTATPVAAVLDDGQRIETRTLVSTVPSSPHPLIEKLPIAKQRGRVDVDEFLQVRDCAHVWALGDCALVPIAGTESFSPPTAQHAIRQAQTLANNIASSMDGRPMQAFHFQGLGKLGALGHRSAVAELFGRVRISGFLAWVLWRSIYWWKLPGISRKVKVGLGWFLDVLFSPNFSQLKIATSQGVSQAHFETGEFIFRQGDLGDALYIIVNGSADVLREENGKSEVIAQMTAGDIFGEMALLQRCERTASVRCATPLDVIVVRKNEFGVLAANLPQFRGNIERVMADRLAREQNASEG